MVAFERIKDRKIKMALVGCGRISNRHIAAVKEHAKDIDLIAVCDTNAERLSHVAKQTEAKAFSSLPQLLAETDADLVTLCTPSGLHPQQVMQCAAARRHVMTEKPMATRWKDGREMVRACDDAGVRLFVVKQNRHNATIQMLKRAVDKGRFGRIHMVQVNVFWTRPQEYYDSAAWRGTWEFDGGALMNQASHYIDLLDWLIGPVDSVQAMTGTLARDIEVEDSAVMNVRWRSGTLGGVSVSMLTYPENFEGSVTILGEKGTVRLGGVAVNEIQRWAFADADEDDEQIKQANYQTTSVYGFGHALYYDNVIKALRGEIEPQTDGREGLRSLELLIAAYLSARYGKRVALPLEY